MLFTGAMNLLQGAPHPNAARVFLNYLLTREAQEVRRRRSRAGRSSGRT